MKKLPLVILLLGAVPIAGFAQGTTIRVRDLPGHVGTAVTIKVRTGIISASEEKPGLRAFTVRDDYGDQAVVRTAKEYPTFGATYFITGVPSRDPATRDLILQEQSRRSAYSSTPSWLLPGVAAVVALGVLTIWILLRRQKGTALAPPWGFAEVIAGPDRGKVFSLRDNRVLVGRGLDPITQIDLTSDESVSREHGAIVREGKAVFYEDLKSRNGSRINGSVVPGGGRVELKPGAEIGVGTGTTLRVGSPGSALETVGPGAQPGAWTPPGPGATVGD